MKRKKFVFNDELWYSGWLEKCDVYGGNIVCNVLEDEKAVYISPPLDSGEKGTVWNRMKINFTAENGIVAVSYFACDEKNTENGNIQAVIENTGCSIMDKLYFLDNMWINEKKNADDILITDAKGRYLFFKIEMSSFGDSVPIIEALSVEYPMESICEYLPAFYNDNESDFLFINRFLGIYQSLIYDLQDNIDDVSRNFDYEFADGSFLRWLLQWVGGGEFSHWNDKKIRQFIKISFSLYQKKGTRQGIESLVEFYSGKKPIIIETFEIMESFEPMFYRENYRSLYGDNIYSFYVIIEDSYIKSNEEWEELKQLIDKYKPAHTKANMVLLKDYMILGQHTYLGINTRLSKSSEPQLDNRLALPFGTTILN